VSRDVLVAAIAPVIARGRAACPELLEALADPRVHVRYAANLALQRITGESNPGFTPHAPPDDPAASAARRSWAAVCTTPPRRR